MKLAWSHDSSAQLYLNSLGPIKTPSLRDPSYWQVEGESVEVNSYETKEQHAQEEVV